MIILGNRLDLYEDPTYSGTTSQSGQGKEGSELQGGMEWIKKTGSIALSCRLFPDHLLTDSWDGLPNSSTIQDCTASSNERSSRSVQ